VAAYDPWPSTASALHECLWAIISASEHGPDLQPYGFVPVGNGQAAWGLSTVLAAALDLAVAVFLATTFLEAIFFADVFFEGAAVFFDVIGVFFVAGFFTAILLIAFLAGALVAATFLLVADDFIATFLSTGFFALALLAELTDLALVLTAETFFDKTFFAVAIAFLLDHVERQPHASLLQR
jgi:hypothetical protein